MKLSLMLLLILGTTSTYAMGNRPPSSDEQPQIESANPQDEVELRGMFDKMTAELTAVEQLLSQNKYGEALKTSKEVLDIVRVRTGIHPKALIREKIKTKGLLQRGENFKSFNQLTNRQKEHLARAVLNHRGGLYFDILNQTKRATLLYLKAFYIRLKQDGKLLQSDLDKLWNDIMEITSIPIIITETSTDEDFMMFDSDVANSDQQYLFNREIKIFALGISDWTLSEEQFNQKVNATQERLLTNFNAPAKAASEEFRRDRLRQCAQGLYEYTGHEDYNRNISYAMTLCEEYTPEQIACGKNMYPQTGHENYSRSISQALKLCKR